MVTLDGTSAFGGIAFGKIAFYRPQESQVERKLISDVTKEIERANDALQKAVTQLQEIYIKAVEEVGDANALIFEVHQMMLQEEDFQDSIFCMIESEKVSAEYAINVTGERFSKMFADMDDSYMQERAADVKDISERVITILNGTDGHNRAIFDQPVILAADDLSPSETVQLDKSKILSFITKYGSLTSHTAILARIMNIPAIVGLGDLLKEEYNGMDAIVDGTTGKVYIDPDEDITAVMQKKSAEEASKRHLLEQLRGKENITLDGIKVDVFANIGGVEDVSAVLQNDGGGVGLFRSEFLYLGTDNYPSEEDQFKAYKQVSENLPGKKVIIRTLDIGADKQIDYFDLPAEENPALGFRAIRICLERPDIFKTQLRAIYRASAFGKTAIMFPMITAMEEIKAIKIIVQEVKEELDNEGLAYDKNLELGIMIETPAAVMISDELAKEVDFFSIGTNDLLQYTIALDRQNPKLERFYNPHHKALLRMIKMVVESARSEKKWVGICGELASDLTLTPFFLSIGVDELSVSPPYILPLREKIRSINISEIKQNNKKNGIEWI